MQGQVIVTRISMQERLFSLLGIDDKVGRAVVACRYMCVWSDLCQWHMHTICQSWADFANPA